MDHSGTSIDALLAKLTREEKVSLLAATDWWRTPEIRRDGIFVPHIKATDGPNGARGESYVSGIKAACFPCGTSLGASFDRALVFRTGQEIAKEAKLKSANVLLAPTLNVIRSPRGGRNYETFSEDPVVLGNLAAAFINGCQSEGIAATPKHFVANETENNRKVLTAEVDEQTLREIYMMPFQILMRFSDPWCLMTSYNRVNGIYVADDARLVNGILRKEWGFKGLVVSDWMGVYSTAACINAGVDLEMPGPTKLRGDKLLLAMKHGQVSETTVNDSARRVLELACKLGRFETPNELPEQCVEDDERNRFICEAGARGMVLLKNDGVLPMRKGASVALIGHHAQYPSLGGGGSARVDSIRAVSPAEGLRDEGFEVTFCAGVPVYGALPHADPSLFYHSGTKTQAKEPVVLEWFNGPSIGHNLVHQETRALPEYMIKEKWPVFLDQVYCSRMTFDICPTSTGDHVFSVISTGPAICYVNGQKVFERPQETDLNPESFYFFKSKLERRFSHRMEASRCYTVVLESWFTDQELLRAEPLNGRMFQGAALRFQEFVDVHQRIQDACIAARESDYAVVCVGTTNEIESEGFDRETMDLTDLQYQQIEAISRANPRTIVVNFSGGPVTMTDFIDEVAGVIQAWFPGQECGHSLAKVVSGAINPSGRLPFTWPRKDEDNPTFHNFPCDAQNVVRYDEKLDVGYRYYDRCSAPTPLFPFGFGLSYTNFRIDNITAKAESFSGVNDAIEISCNVHNVGGCNGAVVIQFYVQMPKISSGWERPVKELKEFWKAELTPGTSQEACITLDKYSISFFNATQSCWQVQQGMYQVHVGLSSQEVLGTLEFSVPEGLTWNGI
ncbi:uncharacterized protein N7484_006765 [Penicillium longicatenatum]|uniref:uncharacterized protein n=1 Tax=Penicillium longicatenatum TaxID=1561947 RepID=UPI0025484195|nr:uncharacterized protein N7484_006765 [Penicillium longicatenatum]KAJ5644258.1 hypothetical protein N7484_006765 [Penicillium longicatenatum]